MSAFGGKVSFLRRKHPLATQSGLRSTHATSNPLVRIARMLVAELILGT